jgi:3-deoxy-D-manno-octulosonic-acid transferase
MISALIPFVALFDSKTRKFLRGRKDWRKELKSWREKNHGELIWFHAASLGEFEQGRPLMEKIREQTPHKILLLTFFSPSGYEVRRDYHQVNGVFYLPLDTAKNAGDFVQLLNPSLAVFIKYEVWPNYFKVLKFHGIRLIMISVNFRENQRFFRGVMRWWWNEVLKNCQQFFTQNERTTQLLLAAGHPNVITAGDTRYDRVFEVASHTSPPKELIEWKGIDKLLIAGSTWPDDDKYIYEVIQKMNGWKVLFFPHNLNQTQIEWILKNCKASRWSTRKQNSLAPYNTIVVDEIGWLNSAYGVADIAWIGGGFNKGIHNTLEAASWGVPVCFGPKFEKFEEAQELIAHNAARSARSADDLSCLVNAMSDDRWLVSAGEAARNCVHTHTGATNKILRAIGLN